MEIVLSYDLVNKVSVLSSQPCLSSTASDKILQAARRSPPGSTRRIVGRSSEESSVRLLTQSRLRNVRIFSGKLWLFHYSYTGYIETNYGWILWEKKTWTGGSRAPAEVIAGPSPAECPVIWRQWPSDNATIGKSLKK